MTCLDQDSFVLNMDGASPVPSIHEERAACINIMLPVLQMMKLISRWFSLWLVLVGSLYLLHIAREYVVVGAAHEIYGS